MASSFALKGMWALNSVSLVMKRNQITADIDRA
jgi:hypothetical protein